MTPEEQRGQAWLDRTKAEYEQIADGTTLAFYQKGKLGELLEERDTQAKQVSVFEGAWQLESDKSCVLERELDLLRKALLERGCLRSNAECEYRRAFKPEKIDVLLAKLKGEGDG